MLNWTNLTETLTVTFRHPSYAGWFLWSLGSQLILVNPFCLLAYAYVSFSFFSERIYCEEFMLLKFFGKEYREYQATGT